jgi:hypothetical protein
MNKQPQEVPLIELLKAVPKTARLIVDSADGISSTVYPVGHLCHEAAEALEIANCDLKEPAQEPVATVKVLDGYDIQVHWLNEPPATGLLYTHPHQWQGLKDDEIIDMYFQANISPQPAEDVINFIRAIEAKLKEKNT